MGVLEVNGASLATARTGNGPPLLFVHGSASDQRTWATQVAELCDKYEVITYSRRYHRPNPSISAGVDYSMAEQAADLEALVGALGVGPVHLVAHSYGAVLAIIVAARSPSLFRTLVLEEPPAFNLFTHDPPRPLELLRLLLTHPRLAVALLKFGVTTVAPAQKAAKRDDFASADRIFSIGVLGQDAYAALSQERLKQAEENSFPEELLGSGFVKLDRDETKSIPHPTLVISGKRSQRLWIMIADQLAAHIPNAVRLEIAEAGHIVHEDNPIDYNSALREFLESEEESHAPRKPA